MSVPLYAPTPIQPAHPTPFYIEDILGRTTTNTSSSSSSASSSSSCSTPVIPTPTLPSPNSSFTSLISPYRTPIYEPTPIHPALSHHAALTATYASAGAFTGSMYPFHHQHHRSMGEYAQALLRHDHLGKPLLWTPFIQRPLHKRKGGQVRFSNDQTIELEKKFETQKYLSHYSHTSALTRTFCLLTERLQHRTWISADKQFTHTSHRRPFIFFSPFVSQVKTWFQNRRAKWRRLKQENPPAGKREAEEDGAAGGSSSRKGDERTEPAGIRSPEHRHGSPASEPAQAALCGRPLSSQQSYTELKSEVSDDTDQELDIEDDDPFTLNPQF
ncbi:hematopoietically-expressed homeobox protein hhex [Stegastes partitus]|uniref:Hematopoietically-expressed homeobox protein hhex n=1 Tax=Stegastes partitus TaxID=144197 RepID=A0A9Y4MVZ4_9TELE|nr:PREDICTED: hematopoietically-expressed homeobox protein HHEX [Stegastes partitus]